MKNHNHHSTPAQGTPPGSFPGLPGFAQILETTSTGPEFSILETVNTGWLSTSWGSRGGMAGGITGRDTLKQGNMECGVYLYRVWED